MKNKSSLWSSVLVALAMVGCAASPGDVSSEPVEAYDSELVHLELHEVVTMGEPSDAVERALEQLDTAPIGSTLTYPAELVMPDGTRMVDTVTVRIEDALEADPPELVSELGEVRAISEPLHPIPQCIAAQTISTRSRTRSWEWCLGFPDTEARADAQRAVAAAVDTACRSTLSISDGDAFCAARGDVFVDGSSEISRDGICERESITTSIAHSRGAGSCVFGLQTYVSRATATSTQPSCGFACL